MLPIMKIFKFKFKNFKSFCGKKDTFDCAGIRAQVFRNAVESVFFAAARLQILKFKFEFNLHLFAI